MARDSENFIRIPTTPKHVKTAPRSKSVLAFKVLQFYFPLMYLWIEINF